MSNTRPEALLFDLGGVVINIDFNKAIARWATHAACDERHIRERYSHDDAYKQFEVDGISAAEYFASLRTSLQINISDEAFLDGWNAIFGDELPRISELLAKAAKKLPIYAFSNSNHAHELFWSKRYASTLSHFKTIFVSSKIGLRKPDAAAFQYIETAINVPARHIIFFDDVLENVVGAQKSGLRAIHVTSTDTMRRVLESDSF